MITHIQKVFFFHRNHALSTLQANTVFDAAVKYFPKYKIEFIQDTQDSKGRPLFTFRAIVPGLSKQEVDKFWSFIDGAVAVAQQVVR